MIRYPHCWVNGRSSSSSTITGEEGVGVGGNEFKSFLGLFCSLVPFFNTAELLKIIQILKGFMDHLLVVHWVGWSFKSVIRPYLHSEQGMIIPISFAKESMVI